MSRILNDGVSDDLLCCDVFTAGGNDTDAVLTGIDIVGRFPHISSGMRPVNMNKPIAVHIIFFILFSPLKLFIAILNNIGLVYDL